MNYDTICFVIMPFDIKDVGPRKVNFNDLYDTIFRPAISEVKLPEGGNLEPHRTDKDFFTGDIKQDMFEYLEYSRFALADISGLNFNVAYELGARHRAREAGTAIFRLIESPIPFDISSIKAFPYEYEPAENAELARDLIKRVLTESLVRNRLDSPVRIALSRQRESGQTDELLKAAENSIRNQDWPGAMQMYRDAIAVDADNPLLRMKLGLQCRDRGVWDEALEQFTIAASTMVKHGEAYREKGVVESQIARARKEPLDTNPAPGEASLRRAIELNGRDFDAWASLGGVLKRAGRYPEALAAYERSLEVSGGHPYPLLNALKLRVQVNGRLGLTGSDRRALARAEHVREGQTKQNPPYDKPWCFFDLAEIRLYRGDISGFRTAAEAGVAQTDHDWQVRTFLENLQLLKPAASELPGLDEAIADIEKRLA